MSVTVETRKPPGVKEVQVIRIDGSRRTLNAGGKAVTLSITEDPLLLLYDGGENSLPQGLGVPLAMFESLPQVVERGGSTKLYVGLNGSSDLSLTAPPFWTVQKSLATPSDKPSICFTLTAPEVSSVREADFVVTLSDSQGRRRGELYYRSVLSK